MAELTVEPGTTVEVAAPVGATVEVETPSWQFEAATPAWNFELVTPQTSADLSPGATDVDVLLVPGPQGPIGPEGPSGALRRFYGEGPPGVILGAEPGDEYLDTLTGNLYVLS